MVEQSGRGCAHRLAMVFSNINAGDWQVKEGATDVAPGGGATVSTGAPERTRPQKGRRPNHVQGWVVVCSVAWSYPSMLGDGVMPPQFDHARCFMPSGQVRRIIGPAKCRTEGCPLFFTPGQQGGSRRPPAGGPCRRSNSQRQETLMISSKKKRITRNPTTPSAMCTTSRSPGHTLRAGGQKSCFWSAAENDSLDMWIWAVC